MAPLWAQLSMTITEYKAREKSVANRNMKPRIGNNTASSTAAAPQRRSGREGRENISSPPTRATRSPRGGEIPRTVKRTPLTVKCSRTWKAGASDSVFQQVYCSKQHSARRHRQRHHRDRTTDGLRVREC